MCFPILTGVWRAPLHGGSSHAFSKPYQIPLAIRRNQAVTQEPCWTRSYEGSRIPLDAGTSTATVPRRNQLSAALLGIALMLVLLLRSYGEEVANFAQLNSLPKESAA